ncbi:MAG: MerR family transcriptional regulator [Candidatus Korobacteraceae bacterium]
MAAGFSSNEVSVLTGITPRQLQWWDERGIVAPRREGRRRVYSFEDLAEVAVICDLRRRGFSLQRVRKVMRFLQRELARRLVETVSGASEYHLLTDGRHIFLEDSARRVVDLLKNSRQPMLTICLSDTVRRIRAEVRAHKNDKGQRVRETLSKTSGGSAAARGAMLRELRRSPASSRTPSGRLRRAAS